jgi:flagellar FliJ protein
VKKFRFSLETVLKVKRQVEEARQKELATAQGKRDHCLMQLSRLEQDLQGLLKDRSSQRQGRVDLAEEAWHSQRQWGLNHAIGRALGDLRGSEKELEAARERAVEAARERRVLEKLEEHQLQAHLFNLNREEQGLLDDLAQRAVSAFRLPPLPAEGL